MADQVTITFTRERTITETFTNVRVEVERLRALVAELAEEHADDIVNGLTAWNVDDLAPVLAAIVAETNAVPTESKTDDSISRITEDADAYLCGAHLVDEHCSECGECPDECSCDECEECGESSDDCACEEEEEDDEDDA